MNKKTYPKAVVLKRNLLAVVIFGAILLIMLIIGNFIHANNEYKVQQQSETVKTVDKKPTESDANWYKNRIIKPLLSINPAKPMSNNLVLSGTSSSTVVAQSDQCQTPQFDRQQMYQAQEAFFKAMSTSINSNQLVSDPKNNTKDTSGMSTSTPSATVSLDNEPNKQAEKIAFLKDAAKTNESDYLSAMLKKPLSPYELQAGTIVPAVLVTGIDSDLPGQITGQVKSNVYDSISGNYLLIPQGAKLVGTYASQVSYGQERVLVVWHRIIFPNGQNLDLQGMPGVDMSGYSGFNDQVNNHYTKIFGSVLLMSMLSSGAQLAQPNNSNDNNNSNPSINQTMAQSLGTNISAVGTSMTMKNLNIQPTLEIRQGYEFNIEVKKDIVFDGPYQAEQI